MYPNVEETQNKNLNNKNNSNTDISDTINNNKYIEKSEAWLMKKQDLQESSLFFEQNLTFNGNDKCFDCGQSDPQWVSVSYAILICFKCSGDHRSFGTHISVVKSTYLDEWTNKNLKKLEMGGNQKFRELFASYNIDLHSLTMEQKYYSKLACYYRNYLERETTGHSSCEPIKPLSLDEALSIINDEPNNDIGENSGVGSANDSNNADYTRMANEALAKLKTKISWSGEYLSQTYEANKNTDWLGGIKSNVSYYGSKVGDKYEENKPYISEKWTGVKESVSGVTESEKYKQTKDYVSSNLSWLSSKAKDSYSSYFGYNNTADTNQGNGNHYADQQEQEKKNMDMKEVKDSD